MSELNEGDPNDLFDFPEVEGMAAFGLQPPPGWGAGAPATGPEGVAEAAGEADEPSAEPPVAAVPDAGAAAEPAAAPAAPTADARPNPPVPSGTSDLDEDLFGFDELFSADDDPYQNGTLTPDGRPVGADLAAAPEAAATTEPAPEPTRPPEAAAPESSPQPTSAPAPPAPGATAPAPGATVPDSSLPAAGSLMREPVERAALDRGPRILLPEDVPYGGAATSRDARLVWALVACFLIVNTGIFWLAHLASTNVNQSITSATGVIAEALAGRGGAPVHGAAPPVQPEVVYESIERDEADSPVREAEPWVDPRNFEGTHRFAVGRAKALLAEGQFEDARRLLHYVLANKDRVPLTPELREEIDYLIPLTYYDQGRATAPSEGEDR